MAHETDSSPQKRKRPFRQIYGPILLLALILVILFLAVIAFTLQQHKETALYENVSYNNAYSSGSIVRIGSLPETITPVWMYSATGKSVRSVAISGDGRYVAAGSGPDLYCLNREGILHWNYTPGSEPGTYGGTFRDLSISDDGKFIVGSLGFTFYYFSQNGTRLLDGGWGFEDGIESMDLSAEGKTFVIGTSGHNRVWFLNPNGNIPSWHFTTFNRKNTSESYAGNHVAMSADGQYVGASGEDSRVYYFNQSGALLWKSNETGRPLENIAMSADGHTIAAASRDHSVYVFDNTGNLLWNATTGDVVRTIAMSSDGKYIVAGSDDSGITFFDRNGTLISTYIARKPVTSLAISRNGNTIVAGSKDSGIYCFDQDGTLLWKYIAGKAVNRVAVSGDGIWVVAGSSDGNVYFFSRNGTADGHS